MFCKRCGVAKISEHYGVGHGSVPCRPLFLSFLTLISADHLVGLMDVIDERCPPLADLATALLDLPPEGLKDVVLCIVGQGNLRRDAFKTRL